MGDRHLRTWFLWLGAVTLVCSCNPSSGKVSGALKFLKGASGGSASALGVGAPTDGNWLISPDKARITLVSIAANSSDGGSNQISVENCTVEYDASLPTLVSLGECTVEWDVGTYASVSFSVDSTFEILIDDPVNGIFTDPDAASLASTVEPVGGAQFVTLGVGQGAGVPDLTATFVEPLVIDENSLAPSIDAILHGVHTVWLFVTGTSLELNTQLPAIPFPAPSAIGAIKYYSNLDTAANAYDGPGPAPPIPSAVLELIDVNGPVYVGYNSPTFQTCFPGGGTFANRESHYLGLDSSSKLCWRVESNVELGTYMGLMSMPELSQIGQSGAVSCFATADPPEPADGVSYASGCPSFTPDDQVTMFLVAD